LEDVDVRAPIFGTLRATFIVGPDGIVAHVIPRVTPRTHDDEVLAVLEHPETAQVRSRRIPARSLSFPRAPDTQ
jgi:alkyl hydroperoxide reductase subunit AhpC